MSIYVHSRIETLKIIKIKSKENASFNEYNLCLLFMAIVISFKCIHYRILYKTCLEQIKK